MTVEEKNRIIELRNKGMGYGEISKILNISKSTISTFCNSKSFVNGVCPMCGNELIHVPGKKRKRFCSDKCRLTWWNQNRDKINRKTFEAKCQYCGKEFISFRGDNVLYCSRECYLKGVSYGKK